MTAFQLTCVAVVALYWVVRLARAPARERGRIAVRLTLLSIAGWVGEDTVIRAYGFYGYSASWSLILDRAPLLVACIWPIVIDSASQLARRIAPHRVVLATAALVLADAALIEPISVRAGLWAWAQPGVFAVPLIGVAGWAMFAGAAVAFLTAVDRRRAAAWVDAGVILIAPLATHAMLVAAWWGAFKWASAPLPDWVAVAAAWGISMALAWTAARSGIGARVPLAELLVRLPGAAVFFVLLFVSARGSVALVAWALAFVPPYLALVTRGAPDALATADPSR
ncbi:MAG TPA: hypothetical protein VGL81_04735 [Polyangiaceae bacterium]